MSLIVNLFTGQWCPSCKPRTALIADLCAEHSLDLEYYPLETMDAKRAAVRFHVDRIPTVVIQDKKDDQVLVQFGPQATEQQIKDWLKERIAFDAEPKDDAGGKSDAEEGKGTQSTSSGSVQDTPS